MRGHRRPGQGERSAGVRTRTHANEMTKEREATISPRGRLWTAAFLIAVSTSGCATMEVQDYTFEIRGVGDLVKDVSVDYGAIAVTRKQLAKSGGGGWTQPMRVPETLNVKWTTTDGQRHEVTAPIKAKVPVDIRGKTVSAQIDGATLRVFLLERGSGLSQVGTQIYP